MTFDHKTIRDYILKRRMCIGQFGRIISAKRPHLYAIWLGHILPSRKQLEIMQDLLSGKLKVRKWRLDHDPEQKKNDRTRKNHCKGCGRRFYEKRTKKVEI